MRQQAASVLPSARVENLVLTETKDEVLVYDTASHHIHHLNQVSAVIWRLCDGRRSIGDITSAATVALGIPVNDTTVKIALGKLNDANLLVESLGTQFRSPVQSRRTLLKRAAVAGTVALPAIVSISAPQAASAQSGGNPSSCGNPCTRNNNCNGCCSQCNGDGTTVPGIAVGVCFNPGRGGNDPSLTCNSN